MQGTIRALTLNPCGGLSRLARFHLSRLHLSVCSVTYPLAVVRHLGNRLSHPGPPLSLPCITHRGLLARHLVDRYLRGGLLFTGTGWLQRAFVDAFGAAICSVLGDDRDRTVNLHGQLVNLFVFSPMGRVLAQRPHTFVGNRSSRLRRRPCASHTMA